MSHAERSPKATIHAIAGAKRTDRGDYDRALVAYLANPSERHVARECGLSRDTVRRLLYEGHSRLGLPPIAERIRAAHRKAAEAEDYDLVAAHRETLRALRAYKAKFLARFLSADVADSDLSVAMLEKLARLEAFLCGAADHRVAVSSDANAIERMSLEERAGVFELAREAVLAEAAERRARDAG